MTEYEVYSYEAFRKKYQDDIRPVPRVALAALDGRKVGEYVELLKEGKPNLSNLSEREIVELMSVTRNETVTLSACMLFSAYPQAYFPQLCITAVAVPGKALGEVNDCSGQGGCSQCFGASGLQYSYGRNADTDSNV